MLVNLGKGVWGPTPGIYGFAVYEETRAKNVQKMKDAFRNIGNRCRAVSRSEIWL